MTNEPSPRPWQVRYGDTVVDATGAKVAACLRPENAALIVAAVNKHGMPIVELIKAYDALKAERDHLRDIVRTVRDTIELQATFDDKGGFHLDNVPACVIAKDLLSEASAAIGEDKP